MKIINRVPADVLAQETAYVLAAPHWLARVWRALRAAWRCSQIAARYR